MSNTHENYEIALLEKFGDDGLTKPECMCLYDMLSSSEAYPLEILGDEGSAIGLITKEAAAELGYSYGEESELGLFISDLIDCEDNRSDDDTYIFKEHNIWFGEDLPFYDDDEDEEDSDEDDDDDEDEEEEDDDDDEDDTIDNNNETEDALWHDVDPCDEDEEDM